MAVKKSLSLKKSKSADTMTNKPQVSAPKRRKYNTGCFSFNEISLPGEGQKEGVGLIDMDSKELKARIIKWAKSVAVYAHQVSGKLRIRSTSRTRTTAYGSSSSSSSSSAKAAAEKK